jgi:hypothetical protein
VVVLSPHVHTLSSASLSLPLSSNKQTLSFSPTIASSHRNYPQLDARIVGTVAIGRPPCVTTAGMPSSSQATPLRPFKSSKRPASRAWTTVSCISLSFEPVFPGRHVEGNALADRIIPIDGREIPTLRSYISSVAPGTPFRISIHNWELPYTPSAIIESRRRSGEKIVLMVQVSIDGNQSL